MKRSTIDTILITEGSYINEPFFLEDKNILLIPSSKYPSYKSLIQTALNCTLTILPISISLPLCSKDRDPR